MAEAVEAAPAEGVEAIARALRLDRSRLGQAISRACVASAARLRDAAQRLTHPCRKDTLWLGRGRGRTVGRWPGGRGRSQAVVSLPRRRRPLTSGGTSRPSGGVPVIRCASLRNASDR